MKIDLDHVARLANLKLSQEEKKLFEKQLEEIIRYISQLNEVNTEEVEPIAHITGLENVAREDNAAPSLSQDDALRNAARSHNGFFEVDAVFDQNDQ